MTILTQDRLKELLSYDPKTGIFRWRVYRSQGARAGDIAGGYIGKGYLGICVDNKAYRAHRLAFLYVYGRFPAHTIDHINQVKDDNRIDNLRDVTNGENQMNAKKYRNNTSGITGVYWCKRRERWKARIGVKGTLIHLGSFLDIEDAKKVRSQAKIKYNYHFNHA